MQLDKYVLGFVNKVGRVDVKLFDNRTRVERLALSSLLSYVLILASGEEKSDGLRFTDTKGPIKPLEACEVLTMPHPARRKRDEQRAPQGNRRGGRPHRRVAKHRDMLHRPPQHQFVSSDVAGP